MNKYLFISESDAFIEKPFIVKATTPDEAYYLAAKKLYRNDKYFIEYFKECCINSGFTCKFWLQTDKEDDYFNKTGKVSIDFDELQQRIKKYFGTNTKGAEQYLIFYNLLINDELNKANMAFEDFINNNEELLIREWITDWSSYKIINISDIKVL